MTEDIFKAVKVDQETFEKEVDIVFEQMQDILKKKNIMYGGASMDLGMVGNYVHLHDKISRLRKLVSLMFKDEGTKPKLHFEGIEDTLRDLIGYSTIGLIILAEEDAMEKRKSNIPLGGGDLLEEDASKDYVDQDRLSETEIDQIDESNK